MARANTLAYFASISDKEISSTTHLSGTNTLAYFTLGGDEEKSSTTHLAGVNTQAYFASISEKVR